MKTKLFLFFAVLMMSFGVNAQVTSVAVVGEAAGGWPGSPGNPGPEDIHQMTSTDGENWTLNGLVLTTFATDGGIKFRANNDWAINWGAAEFPAGTGTQGGANIQCIAGTYDVTFNSTTGVYNFSGGTPLPTVKLVGAATGTVDGIVMNFSGSDTYRANNVTLLDGAGQFSIDDLLNGEPTFPTGTLTGASDNIPVVAGFYSSVSLNLVTGEYSFVLIPPVSIVGDGVGGWPPFEGADPNQLSSSDAINYSLDKLACILGPAKFRQDNDWTINWGNAAFPTGTATQSGDNIEITAAGTYDVKFNRVTGEYSFNIPTIAIVGDGVGGWPGSAGNPGPIDVNQMISTDGVLYTISDLVCVDGPAKFRANNAWNVNWGNVAFPTGTATQDGDNIVLAAGTYDVTLNRVTGEYSFTPSLSTSSFNSKAFRVFPNPTYNAWNFVSTSDKNITAIQIVDMLGKTVMTINPAATSANVDATSITSGLYFAKVTTTSGTETVKLMKN